MRENENWDNIIKEEIANMIDRLRNRGIDADRFIVDIKGQNTIQESADCLEVDDIDKKIKDSLRIVGLKVDILDRRISTLTGSEVKLLQFALAFITNPKVILLDEPFRGLDLNVRKKLIRIITRLKDKFSKTIVIYSNNPNYLYQYTDYLIVLSNNTILGEGNTSDIFFDSKYNIKKPDIVDFILLVKDKKNVKLPRRKSVMDLIKDIYWNVK